MENLYKFIPPASLGDLTAKLQTLVLNHIINIIINNIINDNSHPNVITKGHWQVTVTFGNHQTRANISSLANDHPLVSKCIDLELSPPCRLYDINYFTHGTEKLSPLL